MSVITIADFIWEGTKNLPSGFVFFQKKKQNTQLMQTTFTRNYCKKLQVYCKLVNQHFFGILWTSGDSNLVNAGFASSCFARLVVVVITLDSTVFVHFGKLSLARCAIWFRYQNVNLSLQIMGSFFMISRHSVFEYDDMNSVWKWWKNGVFLPSTWVQHDVGSSVWWAASVSGSFDVGVPCWIAMWEIANIMQQERFPIKGPLPTH